MNDDFEIYCISGMGLDERLFYRLNIHSNRVHMIHWIEPLKKESLEDYSRRMLQQIKHEGNIVLIGVSFGGMVAIEIAKLKRIQQIILISSIKTKYELPWFFKFVKHIPVYKLSTPEFRRKTRERWGKYFGLKDKESMDFFEDMFEKSSETYKDWAISQIANWQNEEFPSNLVHLQGTKDLIFPYKNVRDATLIEGGTHGMVVSKAVEVSNFINDTLKELTLIKEDR